MEENMDTRSKDKTKNKYNHVYSKDSERIADLTKGFKYDPTKKEEVLAKYKKLIKKKK